MKTKTIGEILKEKREMHRVSLDDLSQETKIKVRYLQLLEDNQFDQLPAASYVRGYIKAYARMFGFDHRPLLGLLRRDFKESAKGVLVPREFIKPVIKKRRWDSPVTAMLIGLASIFAVLLIYIGVQWYNFQKPPKLVLYSPEEDSLVAAQVIVEGQTAPESLVLVNAQPVSLQADGYFKTEVYLPREGIATITVEATDRREKTSILQRTVYVKF